MKKNKRTLSARRVATFVAAAGALVLSSGVALIVTAGAANAATPVNICHATSSDSNPYVLITVDDDSVKFAGHLAHRNDPNKRWKSDGTFNGVPHVKNQAKPDIIGDYVGPNGPVVLDGVVDATRCNGDIEVEVPDEPTTASVSFIDPSCANENAASYDPTGDHATFELDGTVAAGQSVTVTATVDDGFTFPDDAQVLEFDHTFTAAEEDCNEVTPPVETPPVVATPTVVHAGLIGSPATVTDMRTEHGVALLAGGLLLMLVAGGLARPRGVRS